MITPPQDIITEKHYGALTFSIALSYGFHSNTIFQKLYCISTGRQAASGTDFYDNNALWKMV
jgi:hypothetical protein